jgi:hypothetical protein
MWNFPNEHQLSEIGINRHENSLFARGDLEQRPVAGVWSKLPRLDDVMPLAT